MTGTSSGGSAWRVWAVMMLMALPAAGVVIRLFSLQVVEHQKFADLAETNQNQIVDVEPWRGQIFDRNGVALAVNQVEYEISASPDIVTSTHTVAERLAPLLNRPRAEIQSQLDTPASKYQLLARRVSKPIGEAIRDLHFLGIQVTAKQLRAYPDGQFAAHVLGFVAANGIGYYGVESQYQAELAGEHGTGEVSTSPLDVPDQPHARPGADLYLTIDRDTQFVVEQTLADALTTSGAKSGTIIVMDPRTGALLAMASTPAYDPNVQPDSIDDPLRINPAISAQYEPGSVFKILTLALALDSGTVTPQSSYYDSGQIWVGGVPIHNWDGGAWGQQDLTGLMAHSLNVGAAWLSTSMGPDAFYKGLQRFHLGQPLGVDLAGEAAGRLKLPGDEDWFESDLGTNAYGQGVAVTPLQMIAAVAAVANHGQMMQPYVVAATVRDGRREERQPVPLGQPISPDTAREVTTILSASSAREVDKVGVPGYTVAGKTGTASIVRDGGFYDPQATIASYIGYLPAGDPRLIVLVKLDEPTVSEWGSVVAAPVFSDLAAKLVVLWEIPPDSVRAGLGH